jgi:NAD(P)-dependent dehydrogenase (short-subunit alcohol dehydrogenase family)
MSSITTIEGRSVLVTGANRGIGRALVQEALRQGASRVYAAARQPQADLDERVTPLTLDVTDSEQIRQAAASVPSLDILINNAGWALADDLSDRDVLERHLAVNLFGTWSVSQAFLPSLARSRGAIVNNLSVAAFAAVPVLPAYSVSKAAAFSLSQSMRALLNAQGVGVHVVLPGPVDTDMSRDLQIPKASPESVARAILAGLERGEEEIFPDPLSQTMAEAWRSGAAKALERDNAALLPHNQSYTTAFVVDQTPDEVFDAINDVRGWWSGEIDGETDKLGAVFTYRNREIHRSKQEITELVPGKKVAWHVLDGYLSFIEEKTEWTGTDIVFEIGEKDGRTEVRFTHVGLAPRDECYGVCSDAWGALINGNLRRLIVTGQHQSSPFAAAA